MLKLEQTSSRIVFAIFLSKSSVTNLINAQRSQIVMLASTLGDFPSSTIVPYHQCDQMFK